MTVPMLLGLGFGAALALLVSQLVPPKTALAQAFATLHPHTPPPQPALMLPVAEGGGMARLGRPLAPLLAHLGLPRAALAKDLAICGRDAARHRSEQAALALIGLLIPPAVPAVLSLLGFAFSWQTPLWTALVAAAIGLFLPDVLLAREATRRRRQLRNATAGMLDLIVIALAGGAGIEQALHDATDTPEDWAQQALRQAIDTAHLTRQPPWHTLAALGHTTAVTTLQELAAALSLAGSEGARIKTSLSARSAAVVAHRLAEAESAALSATERMALPVVGLLGGFLLFIGYPAFVTVTSSL